MLVYFRVLGYSNVVCGFTLCFWVYSIVIFVGISVVRLVCLSDFMFEYCALLCVLPVGCGYCVGTLVYVFSGMVVMVVVY